MEFIDELSLSLTRQKMGYMPDIIILDKNNIVFTRIHMQKIS